MSAARHYWLCTVTPASPASPASRPHATPVDGHWFDDRLYFGGSPQTRWTRNLGANPAVCVHLESGVDVVMLQGAAHMMMPEQAFVERLAADSMQKYGYAPALELYLSGIYEFRPTTVFAWTHFPDDVTRWTLGEGEAGGST
jgi:hypothetical protein